ncbi:hypothetical protein ACHWQZ_G004053 [Mnemiopsis leidyi]
MRTLALYLFFVLQVSGSENRTTLDDILDLKDGAKCPKGTWSVDGTHLLGIDDCEQCYEGEFNNEEGALACSMCPAGSYTPDMGYWECLKCPAGQITTEDGNYECFPCGKGQHSPTEGGNLCQDCLPGHYQDEDGASGCKVCSAGQYQDTPASTSCKLCPRGQITLVEGATSLDQCQDVNCSPGQYRDQVKGCISCPRGTFSNIENAVACRPCPRHQYSSVEGAVQCMQCPVTAFTWSHGTDSLDGCIGPVIEVCTGEDMTGNCYRYYDDNMNLNSTIKSAKVISGEFELFDQNNQAGYFKRISERDGPVNVNELENLSNLRSVKALLNDVFCSLDKGQQFHGSIRSTSKSGKACINWKRTPLAHKAAHNHYCQNPDGNRLRAKPFCYISETETEECDIPSCIWDMDCYTGNGVQYRGRVGRTTSDYDCQNWNRDYPVIHSYHSPEYNWAGVGEHTFCRNPSPGDDSRPWCYKAFFWSWYLISGSTVTFLNAAEIVLITIASKRLSYFIVLVV